MVQLNLNINIMNMISINKTTSLVSLFLILSLVSCSKEQTGSGAAGVSSEKIRITGSDANSTTKTTLNGLVTSWIQTTDKVGIYSSQARTATGGAGSSVVNAQFTAASSGTGSNFTGTMYWGAANTSHTFYAYYPYASGSPAATAVPVSLPSAQTQSAANNTDHIGALDFMIATPVTVTSPSNTGTTGGVNLKYNHLFSVLEFQIRGTGNLNAVSLQSSNTLAFVGGTIDITQSAPVTGTSYNFATQTGTSKMVTTMLTAPGALTGTNADTKVYMVINPTAPAGNCVIGLQINGQWKYLDKAVPPGGFKRGIKYTVEINAADAVATTVTDADGNSYKTVKIGTQVWMVENLKTTKYNDGTAIPNLTDNSAWGSATSGAWSDYDNNTSNSAIYGKLYNWYAVDNNASTKLASNGGKNICPAGWHVPSDLEWTTLTDYVGYVVTTTDEMLGNMTLIYGAQHLKEAGTTHWSATNSETTNSSGFTALPGGYRKYDGWGYENLGNQGYWWSTSLTSDYPIYRRMTQYENLVESGYGSKGFGRSVRCVKD